MLVPAGLRDDWRANGTRSSRRWATSPVRYRRPVRRALGAFADAFWLRQRSIADFDWIDDVRHGVRQLAQHGGFAADRHRHPRARPRGDGDDVQRHRSDPAPAAPLSRPRSHRHGLGNAGARPTSRSKSRRATSSTGAQRAQSFEHLAGVDPWSLDVAGNPRPEVWFSAKVTEGFFETFGVTAAPRPLLHAPTSTRRAAIRCWCSARRSGASASAPIPSIVGRTVRADDGPLTIVGIVPATFEPRLLPTGTGHRNVWQPKAIEEYEPNIRGSGYWAVVGRLKPGVTIESRAGRDERDLAAAGQRVSAHQREDRRARAAAARSSRRQRRSSR